MVSQHLWKRVSCIALLGCAWGAVKMVFLSLFQKLESILDTCCCRVMEAMGMWAGDRDGKKV